jgi:hypothetical protein
MREWVYKFRFSLVPTEKEAGSAPKPVWTTWRRENSRSYGDSNSELSVVQLVEIHR